jgi:hypothetical protein
MASVLPLHEQIASDVHAKRGASSRGPLGAAKSPAFVAALSLKSTSGLLFEEL